jgi:hypothetical protein
MATGKQRTPNFKFVLPRFDQQTWSDDYYNNMRSIDGILSRFFGIANYVGIWQNSTEYDVGDRVLDADQALIYEVQVKHTTDPEPETFGEFRTANPSFYSVFTTEVAFRGEWESDTDYAAGDFVTYTPSSGSNEFSVATTAHQSGSDYPTDRDNGLWNVLLSTADVGDQELAAIANLSTTGFLTRTADNTYATRTITTPNDGLSTTQGDGIGGDPSITLSNDLAAVEGLSSNGIAVRTGTDAWTIRDIVAGDGIDVTDGDGIGGNPTIAVDATVLRDSERESNGGDLLESDDRASNGGNLAETDNTNTFSAGQTFTGTLDHNNTGATRIARGTTAQRPTGDAGDIRWNESNNQYEGYNSADGSWGPLGGAGLYKGENGERGDTVAGAGDIFRINEQTLNTDVTIESSENASCAGPLTIASGVTLTVNGNLTIV